MRKKTILAVLLLSVAASILMCRGGDPIVIGFAGQLTGTSSDLGVQGRNGATLAVEEVNRAGGVAGRQLKLLAMDDGNTPEAALAADERLLAAGAVAIVGHMTSSQTMAVLPMLEARGAVLVSPTTSTPALTAIKDHFFRLIPDNSRWAAALAEFALRDRKIGRVFVLGDSDNASYTTSFNNAFIRNFQSINGFISGTAEFSSRFRPDWNALVETVAASGAQAVVLTASARDVAEFAKARTLAGIELHILCPTWPYTREILVSGGESVEGIVFATSYTEENDSSRFKSFQQRYESRFGWVPSFAAAYSYDAVLLLAKALAETGGGRRGLEEALVSAGTIQGAIGDFSLDQYGDVSRGTFLVTIEQGRFQTLRRPGE
ncbi:MAG: ABC transporter substrate-binding protein [Acidobacteriota bacterium]